MLVSKSRTYLGKSVFSSKEAFRSAKQPDKEKSSDKPKNTFFAIYVSVGLKHNSLLGSAGSCTLPEATRWTYPASCEKNLCGLCTNSGLHNGRTSPRLGVSRA